MGKVIRASVLMLLLACSASAGIITHDVYLPHPPPPPPPAEGVMGYGLRQESEGIMGHGTPQALSVQEMPAETSALVQLALNLLALL